MITAFRNGDLVEVETVSVRAIARVREVNDDGRLHIAFEMGEYFPWVDTDVSIRHFGNDPSQAATARILHAGSTTALLQLVSLTPAIAVAPATDPSSTLKLVPLRGPLDTLPAMAGMEDERDLPPSS